LTAARPRRFNRPIPITQSPETTLNATSCLRRFLFAATAAIAGNTLAQEYPARPLRFIVPFVPGGGLDLTARLIAPGMSQSLGKQVVIDNRPGAGGAIGLEMAARATPDGHTFIMISASHVIQAVMGIANFDFFRDLLPVSEVITSPYVFVASPALPARSIKELVSYARANPGKLNYGSAGNGTLQHLSMELFLQAMSIQAVQVPYKGVGGALPDLIAGRTHIMMSSLSALAPHVRAKTLAAYAVTTRERNPAHPDLPTMMESGVPDYDVSQWQGVLITAGTPAGILSRLHSEIARAAKQPEVSAHFANDGSTTVASTPVQFRATIDAEHRRWAAVIKRAGIKPN